MRQYIENFVAKAEHALRCLPVDEIAKALNILQAVYERDGRLYVFGNGGSLALATHWVSDFNKTVFSNNLERHRRRFQAIRIPTTEEELTAWANDVGFDMVFAGPLQNYLQDADAVIAISSSGNSPNVVKAAELAKTRHVPVIGITGFDPGNALNRISDAKVHVPTDKGEYEVVEGIHAVVLHVMTRYFKDYFDCLVEREALAAAKRESRS
jgi:D-sedoheptulose 7-phosphate isomerase